MLSSKTTINIAIVVLILLIIYFAYSLFSGGSTTDKLTSGAVQTEVIDDTIVNDGTVGTSPASSGATPTVSTAVTPVVSGSDAAAEFVRVLSSLQNVDLSGDIFNSEIFKSRLQDFSRPLPLRLSGRINPFSPFGPSDLVGISNANVLIGINASSSNKTTASTSNLKVSQPVVNKAAAPKPPVKPKAPVEPPANPENAGNQVDLGDQ